MFKAENSNPNHSLTGSSWAHLHETEDKPQKTVNMAGAEAIIQCLIAEGVDIMFGYPGGAIMPTYDVIHQYQKEIKHILVRHEQGAVHAAQGYARVTGKVGVCIATSGPGATNLITGIADAQIDSTPLVCITGQVHKDLLGTDAFQETDIIDISMPVTKWNYKVTEAREIPRVLAKAFFIAQSGRPGPVLVDITKNAQMDYLDFVYKKCKHLNSYVPEPTPTLQSIKDAASLINNARKPLVVFGQGVILGNAEKEFKAFLEKSGIPAAATIMGISAIDNQHDNYVGMLGMHGNYAPNLLTNQCDVLIAIGMRFDDRVTGTLDTYAQQAKIIHLEIDPSEINKNVKVDIAVIGNIKHSLPQITNRISQQQHPKWRQQFNELKHEEHEKVIKQDLKPDKDDISMPEVISLVNELTNSRAIVVTDVGQHQMAACRYSQFKQTRSFITSGGLGTMGFCLPAAIGAKLGQADKTVVGIVGDGGVQMNIQELGTIMQSQIDVKIIILNNQYLGMVRQWQELYFDKRYASTEMINPNYQKLAEAYGISSVKVTHRNELKTALQKMFAHNSAYILEVMVGQENNVFPMISPGSSVSDMRLS
ncbi:MAG: biosynthetic-type acetolactate synthase large subunit [Alcanivoracaceae bacterium]|nr:biosynthetic-type acetolactate synthase large subunit [Alcanivoracaceae bacterium]